jgi:hypothetical protein
MLNDIRNLEQEILEAQANLKKSAKLLDKGTDEYNQLYRSRYNLMLRVAELLLRCEFTGQTRIARQLENILDDEGVVRFAPEVGEPIPRNRCKVSKIEFNGIPPGLVAVLSTPGFLQADGEVLLPAHIFESVLPIQPKNNLVPLISIPGESEDKVLGILLLP